MFKLQDKHIAKIIDIFGVNLRETSDTGRSASTDSGVEAVQAWC